MINYKKYWLLIIMLWLGLSAVPAQAKGFVLFNTGEELFEVKPLPERIIKDYPEAEGLKLGYKCSHFGVFWADVWTWDCKMVGVENVNMDSYVELPEDITKELRTESQYNFSKAQRTVWNHYGVPLALAAFLGFVFIRRSAD